MAYTSSRSFSVALVGLSIALIAVSAWITIPLGPIPFTLQIFTVTLVMASLPPRQASAAIAGYVLLGAIGVPVFSGFRGGFGVLLGPTGGFLWGYVIGVPVASGLMAWGRRRFRRAWPIETVASALFLGIAYACGCLQTSWVLGLSLPAAFMTSIAPFVLLDIIKVALALRCATAVRAAVIIRHPNPET